MSVMWLLVACSEPPKVNRLYPDVSVVPDVVDFGEVVASYSSLEDLLVTNTGQAKLTLSSIEINGDDAAFFSMGEVPETLDPDQTLLLPITFSPDTYRNYVATITVNSDAPDSPIVASSLVGIGSRAATPDIDISPTVLDFGMLGMGTSVSYFSVSNAGDGVLHVSGMSSLGSGAFDVISDNAFDLQPGDSSQVVVSYTPTSTTGDNAILTITSDDPDEPSVDVTFLGNGGGDFAYPVAVIDGSDSTTAEPRKTINLNGSNSYDPSGHTITTYEWSIAQTPESSFNSSISTANDPAAAYFYMDSAGQYEVHLRVKNDAEIWSAPDILYVDAIPQELLHVEMFWDTGSADLDLHLARSEADIYASPDDCNYCNDAPNWGVNGDTDDPSLDLDDRFGYGPENINIDLPAQDTYTIRSHYFADNGDGTVVATVKVYLYGVEEASFSRVMDYSKTWDVAKIHWTGNQGTTYVEELSGDLYRPAHFNCYEP